MRAALAIARQGSAASPAKAPPLPPSRPAKPVPPPLPPTAAPTVVPDDSAPPVPPRPRTPTPRPTPTPPLLRTAAPLASPDEVSISSPRAASRSLRHPLLLGAGVAAVALAVAGLASWLRSRPSPLSSPGLAATSPTVDALTQELVRKQVRLAQRELEDKNYAGATAEAEGALKLAPGHPEAGAILAAARDRAQELERSIAEARRLVDAADTQGASRELSHLLELDPRHPAASELSADLNDAFRAQADEAASSMRAGRAAALAAGAPAEALGPAAEGARRAVDLMAKGEFADATRLFLEARDALDRARRDALTRRLPSPAATPSTRTAGRSLSRGRHRRRSPLPPRPRPRPP